MRIGTRAKQIKKKINERIRFAREMKSKPCKSEVDFNTYVLPHICGNGIRFKRQFILFGYIADYFCEKKRLVIEVDGAIHLSRKDPDTLRDERLLRRGIRTIRVTHEQVMSIPRQLATQLRSEIDAMPDIGEQVPRYGSLQSRKKVYMKE